MEDARGNPRTLKLIGKLKVSRKRLKSLKTQIFQPT